MKFDESFAVLGAPSAGICSIRSCRFGSDVLKLPRNKGGKGSKVWLKLSEALGASMWLYPRLVYLGWLVQRRLCASSWACFDHSKTPSRLSIELNSEIPNPTLGID